MFEHFEHTADLGLRVRAPTLERLFADAGCGLFAMIAEPAPAGEPLRRDEIRLEGQSHELLLFDWLNELLYRFDTERMLFDRFRVSLDGLRLSASAGAFPLDAAPYRLLHEVKAVTYHGLKVERTSDGWLAEVIVDI